MWGVIGILDCRDDDCSRETINAAIERGSQLCCIKGLIFSQ
jgi:hypothetical protein